MGRLRKVSLKFVDVKARTIGWEIGLTRARERQTTEDKEKFTGAKTYIL